MKILLSKLINIIILVLVIFVSLESFAQSPEGMSYQAVVRDKNDKLLENTTIGLRISILKGYDNGEVVYTETKYTTTNNNGLLSIIIGINSNSEGKVNDNKSTDIEDFRKIEWGSTSFFLKTEIDIEGGEKYTITGTSQLLSVPYSFYAKTAETLVGGIPENNYTAGNGITIKDKVISIKKYAVGDITLGGIVFWVNETGQHGLVCTLENVSESIVWMNTDDKGNSFEIGGLIGNGIGAGEINTSIILASASNKDISNTNYAALVCRTYNKSGYNVHYEWQDTYEYGDWYLPSIYELSLLYHNKELISELCLENGGDSIDSNPYWSSNEESNTEAWEYFFNDNTPSVGTKTDKRLVRAVRSF